jgi:hypothetical protein
VSGPSRSAHEPRAASAQSGRLSSSSGEVLDEIQKRRLAPVDVLEADDERPFLRALLERLANAPEDLLARPLERLLREDLANRPERDALAVGQATAHEDGCFVPDELEQLSREPRLADSGCPEDGDQLRRPLLDRTAIGVLEQP